jgi:CRISPR-associated protein (TIGR03984 family)
MKTRQLQEMIETVAPPADFDGNLSAWLFNFARQHALDWLLAQADDGIVWGRWTPEGWVLSSVCFPDDSPPLRAATLQQVRLFGAPGELHLWRTDGSWRGRLLTDNDEDDFIVRNYLLWGTDVNAALTKAQHGLLLVSEGAEGLRHAPPLPPQKPPAQARLAVEVRHYVQYDDDDGAAYVAASRLVKLAFYDREQHPGAKENDDAA